MSACPPSRTLPISGFASTERTRSESAFRHLLPDSPSSLPRNFGAREGMHYNLRFLYRNGIPKMNKSPLQVLCGRTFGDFQKSSKSRPKVVKKSSAGCPRGPRTSCRGLFDNILMKNGCGLRPHPTRGGGGFAAAPPCGRFSIEELSTSPLQDVRGPPGHPAGDFYSFRKGLSVKESKVILLLLLLLLLLLIPDGTWRRLHRLTLSTGCCGY